MKSWRELKTIEDWQETLQGSTERPVIVFKHSTTCPVSANAFQEFQEYLQGQPREDVDYVLVKVIESRPVSNQIADDLAVRHASPQIILVEQKDSVWNSSHWSITVQHISAVLN